MRFREITNEALVPQSMLAPKYFHGTKKQYVKSVLAHGLYPPDFEAFGTRNTALRPVAGRVYMSPNAKEAAGYGRYLMVIYRESLLQDLQPDEDEVGEIFHWIMQKDFADLNRTREIHKNSPDFISRMELLNSPQQADNIARFRSFMKKTLTPKQIHGIVVNGDYNDWARGGKSALKKMPDHIMHWLISIGVHVGCAGRVVPDEAWVLVQNGLLPDGSNLEEVATRIDFDKSMVTDMPPKGPPQKFEATFRYISNWPVFGDKYSIPRPEKLPAPKYKTRKQIFTAPSEEEARVEAELSMERTTPSASYELIDFKKVST